MKFEYLPDHDDRAEQLVLNLRGWNKDKGFAANPGKFSLYAMEGDTVLGGLKGIIEFNWMFIQTMTVENRLNGLGTQLLAQLEEKARAGGITGIALLTLDKQAPGFYEKNGYVAFGILPDFIDGQTRYYFGKRLDGKPLQAQ